MASKNGGNNGQNHKKIYDKFGPDVLQMIIYAKAACIDAKIDCIYPESFIIGILTTGENSVSSILFKSGINLDKCLKVFKKKLEKRCKEKGDYTPDFSNLKISKEISEICKDAYDLSNKLNTNIISVAHIFLAIIEKHNEYKKIVFDGVEEMEEECLNVIKENSQQKELASGNIPNRALKGSQILENFCINMTEMARQCKYDPIIAREMEIEDAITILCRRSKSNPILVGEAGVGKTAIVEGIAQRIISKSVPKRLQDCKIYNLNLTALVAGTKYRGEFEERIQLLIKEVEKDSKNILFIDEIHTILGAGSSTSGSMDAANILKPSLARNLKCIGATTYEEYKKYFCEDSALMRRFGCVMVEEPNDEQTKRILMGIKHKFESFHDCVITDDAIEAAISLNKRYRKDKHFPDKAIDCIDIACAKRAWDTDSKKVSITSNEIASVISKQCSIPLEVILWDSYERVKQTEKVLQSNIIGQFDAVDGVCRILKNAYSGVRNPNKPIGVMVFGGPSGTGKTYTAKQLASVMFGSDNAFIRLDMTEFSESFSISRIIGSPPGYVGFKDVDVVVDKIKRRPYSVVLLDEVEKAHPSVLKLFLQVMGDGFITSASGEKVDCRHIVLIMTGNFGMNSAIKNSLGFNSVNQNNKEGEKSRLISYCEKIFGVEFVNRVDDFITFSSLSDDNLIRIADLRLKDFASRINNPNVFLSFSDEVPVKLMEFSKKEHGVNALAMERIITKHIEPCIADAILTLPDKSIKYNISVFVDVDKFVTKSLKIMN